MPDAAPHAEPPRNDNHTRTGEVIERATVAVDTVAKWTPQATLQVISIVMLGVLVAGFGAMLWTSQNQAKIQSGENRDTLQSLIREANAREELNATRCEQTRQAQQRAADDREAKILAAFMAEGKDNRAFFAAESDKNRAFWTNENEKFRREMIAAIKGRCVGPP